MNTTRSEISSEECIQQCVFFPLGNSQVISVNWAKYLNQREVVKSNKTWSPWETPWSTRNACFLLCSKDYGPREMSMSASYHPFVSGHGSPNTKPLLLLLPFESGEFLSCTQSSLTVFGWPSTFMNTFNIKNTLNIFNIYLI